MRLLFIVPYPKDCAPSQRLRFEEYFDYLQENGIEIIFSSFMTKNFWNIVYKKGFFLKKILYTLSGYCRRIADVFRAIKCDAVYLHLEAAPFGPPVFEYIFKMMKKPIIYDIDDLIYMPAKNEANSLISFFKNPDKVPKIISFSHSVIVSTSYVKDYAKKINENVTCIPVTNIDTKKYNPKDYRQKNKSICIGWIGSGSTIKYLKLISGVLKKISSKHNIKIKVICNTNVEIEGVEIENITWSKDTDLKEMEKIDIGLYPVPRDEWVLGKGAGKALRYMGMGIPTVCTNYGTASEIIENEKTGFLVDTEEEWIEVLSKLAENEKLREKIGLAGRKVVEEKYSVEANKDKMLNAILSAVKK